MNDNYDIRGRPDRGTRVDPLPPHMHREFTRFLRQVDGLVQSHLSTYALADREGADPEHYAAIHLYWLSARKFLRHLEYLGARNDPRRRRSRDRIDDR